MSGKSRKPDLTGYNYGGISSLVLTADRSALPRRDKEPDGAPTSLSGKSGKPDLTGYNYGAISSLVLTADKSALPRRDKEPDGALSGKSGKPDLTGYNYGAISSLVLTADKSALPRRDKEPDGPPTSLAGPIDKAEIDEDDIAVVFDKDQDDEGFEIREESDEEEWQGDGKNHWIIVEWATKSGSGHFLK